MSEKKVILSLEEYEELLKQVAQSQDIKRKNSLLLIRTDKHYFYGTIWNCGIDFPDIYHEFILQAGDNIINYPGVIDIIDQTKKHVNSLEEINKSIEKMQFIIDSDKDRIKQFNKEFYKLERIIQAIPKWIKKLFKIDDNNFIEIGEKLTIGLIDKYKIQNKHD